MDVCKITKEEQKEMFDTFKETLARYKFDWIMLRSIMVSTRAVISGSTALAILLGGEFVPQDLDIYINAKGFAAMLVFLMDHGYQVVKLQLQYALEKEYPDSTIILTLKCNSEGEKIDLIGTTKVHVLTTITQFHSTAAMNYIAFYGIVSLYLEWTMQKKGLVTRRNIPYMILNKYQGCGFKMAYTSAELDNSKDHDCSKHIHCLRTKRELQDGLSLFIPFDDRVTDIREFETKEKMKMPWMLRDVRECRKM